MKNLVFYLVLFGLVFAGCNKEPKGIVHDDGKVEIVFSAKQTSSILKSITGTKEEDAIDRIILFGVDASNQVVGDTIQLVDERLSDALSPSGIKLTIPRNVVKLYAIANPSQGLESQLDAVSNVAALKSLVEDYTVAPDPDETTSFLLMGGNGPVINKVATIELVRAIAKIKFVGANDFVITSVAVAQTPDLGFVFEQNPIAVPTDTSIVAYASTTDDFVYVAENVGSFDPYAQTKFTVNGTFDSKTASYTFALTKNKVPVDIVRNTFYSVSISPVSDIECDIFITIKPWEEGEVDEVEIPDGEFK